MKLSKKKLIIIFIGLVLVGVGYFYSKIEKPVMVESVELEKVVVTKTVSGSGLVKASREASLAIPVSGKLTELNVKKGDFVEQGTLLARVNSSDAYLSTKAREEAVNVAKRDLELYIENYDTNPKAVGGRDEYEIGLKRLQDLVKVSEATYQATLSGLSNYYATAPFSGTVLEVNGEIGELTSVTTPLVKLADLTELVFEIELDQEDFGFVKIGQTAEITLDSYPDKVIKGKVIDVPLFVDPLIGNNFVVKISIEPQEEVNVLSGMDGDVDILIASTEVEVYALTFDRIYVDSDDTHYVWILEDKKLRKFPVEVGLEGDIYTEIKTTIPGEIVVGTDSEIELKEDSPAKLTK